MSGIQHASNQSIKAFKSSEEYLYAMKEDLAEWLKDLYNIDIDVNNILEVLETGAILCNHANNVTKVAEDFLRMYGRIAGIQLPSSGVTCISSAQPSTFLARDNISNFINWCRKQMDIQEVLMFETDDLVLRKNEKNFVLCLLEVARRASRFGMAAPVLIQLEQEIEEEIREEMDLPMEQTPLPKPQRRLANIQNLDEMVRGLISRCTCPTQFPMIKVSEGKYKVGDSNTLIFVRILRNHVMVRVGGGWDTLEHYLDKHDPCRCTSLSHKLAQRPATPVQHEIKTRLGPRSDGAVGTPATLLLSRAQSPLQPVVWSSPGGSTRGLRPAPGSAPAPSPSRSPDPGPRQPRGTSTGRSRGRASTPARRRLSSESRDDSGLNTSTRTGREAVRASPTARHTSSLPRTALSPAVHRESPRPLTPHVVGTPKNPGVQNIADARLNQTLTKSQFVTKLRQSAASSDVKPGDGQNPSDRQRAPGPVRAHTPAQHPAPHSIPSIIKHTVTENCHNSQRSSSSYSSTKGQSVATDGLPPRPFTQIRKSLPASLGDNSLQKKPVSDEQMRGTPNTVAHRNGQHRQSMAKETGLTPATTGEALLNDQNSQQRSNIPDTTHVPHMSTGEPRPGGRGVMERSCLFTPPPITADQEASLYQSLEHEILSNLQQLGFSVDSDDCSSSGAAGENTSQHSSLGRQATEEFSQHPSTGSAFPGDSSSRLQQEEASLVSSSTMPGAGSKDHSFDGVIDELRRGRQPLEKVSVERWVNMLPFGSHGSQPVAVTAVAATAEVDSSPPKSSQSCVAGSWSSMGSSLESKERPEVVSVPALTQAMDAGEVARDSDRQRRPRSSSFRQQRRSLKKPERVPSIYKLKLKPHIRPRQDNRPDRKPSKIPKPISFRRSREKEEAGLANDCTDNGLSPENNHRASGRPLRNRLIDLNSRSISQVSPYEGTQCPAEELESWV
ncbi:GAS2-like protein 2A [Alosa sapidissima]|uniref:GAS2-like protein 2A n=1 Tax=Alosa sapidissima TaxID=34773 RepID=UPI001C09B2C5|nr:GAS2-like protein 2A [Alosa sapidissima]